MGPIIILVVTQIICMLCVKSVAGRGLAVMICNRSATEGETTTLQESGRILFGALCPSVLD